MKYYLKPHFWKYATVFFSVSFFLLDELFIFGLSFIEEEHQLIIHRAALFVIVVAFITWSQYALHQISNMNKSMLQTAKLATLGEMSTSVAHEIVRPIANIDMQCQLNMERHQNDDKFVEFNALIKKQLEKCTALINSLRMFGRNSASAPKSAQDINQIIEESIELTSPYFQFTRVTAELTDALPKVYCNAIQVEQVLANLLVNAKDAVGDGNDGEVIIRSLIGDNQLTIEVEDNGQGISDIDKLHIFDPFYTTKREGKGTGLGLAISKRIIADHEGLISVDSRPGKTIFSITFKTV